MMRPHYDKLFLILAAATMLAGAPAGAGAQSFEGVIRTRTISVTPYALERLGATTPEQVFALPIERILSLKPAPDDYAATEVTVEEEATVLIKGLKVRSELMGSHTSDTAWYSIVDLESGAWRAVQPSQRRYADLASGDGPADRQPPSARAAPANRARPLGVTRTVAGMQATGYEVRSEFEITRGWVTAQQDLARLARAFQKLEAMWEESVDADQEPDADELLLVHGFPLLTQTLDVQDDQLGAYKIEETVSVERKAMPASLFAVPAGYRKVTIEELMTAMQPREP